MPDANVNMAEAFRITEGAEYTYTASWPKGCKGCRYRVECFAILVPAYQEVVVVRCLEGPDVGLVIVCSLSNFASRYLPVEMPAEVPVAPAAVPEGG